MCPSLLSFFFRLSNFGLFGLNLLVTPDPMIQVVRSLLLFLDLLVFFQLGFRFRITPTVASIMSMCSVFFFADFNPRVS